MDIGRALTYFSEDERWVEKTAIGAGLLLISTLLSIALIGVLGYFILFGYLVRLLQNVRDEVQPVLPEWDQWGDDLVRGVKLACVYLVWALPLILVSVPLFIIGIVISERASYGDSDLGAPFILCSICLQFLIGLAYIVFQPGFTIAFARNEVIGDGLQVSEIWEWTRDNIGNVVIVAILTVIASLIIMTVGSIVGLILCVIGVVVTLPLSLLIVSYFQSHLYGQLARLAGSDVATGDFATAPPAPPTGEPTMDEPTMDEPTMDDALPVELVPPVVYDPEAEPEPTAQTEPPVEPEAPAEEEQPAEEDPPAEDQPPEVPKSQ